jgi:hypothetical protein
MIGFRSTDVLHQEDARSDHPCSRLAPASGFSSTVINAGQISNRGFEATINARPIRTSGGLQWNTTINYLRNRNKVDSLAWSRRDSHHPAVELELQARQGLPYGVIFGYAYADSATKS